MGGLAGPERSPPARRACLRRHPRPESCDPSVDDRVAGPSKRDSGPLAKRGLAGAGAMGADGFREAVFRVCRISATQGLPLKILMVAPQPFFTPRGTPFSVLQRIRALSRLGHTVDLVTYPFGGSPDVPGLTIHRSLRLPVVRDVPVGPSIPKLLLDGPLFYRAWSLARRGGYDLLHSHEEAGVLGSRIARARDIPHLYDMHSSLPQQFSNFGRFNWAPVRAVFRGLERYTLAGSDGVIAICPELEQHVLASGYQGPVAMIENTLDFDLPEFSAAEEEELTERLGLRGHPVALYTGTLEQYQGLDMLIEAAPAVLERVPQARFVIVGGTPTQIEHLRALAGARAVESAFVFVPAVPPTEVFLYHRIADVLVTTRSRGTNTPLKVYQYLRAGRPIVATAIRSHTQVLDEETAELVAPEAAAIAAGLLRVLRDPERARALAEAAGRLARERYSEQAYLDRLSEIVERVMHKGRYWVAA
jgi:glycosyltransferase involved in cell wall biosynthesis